VFAPLIAGFCRFGVVLLDCNHVLILIKERFVSSSFSGRLIFLYVSAFSAAMAAVDVIAGEASLLREACHALCIFEHIL